MKTQELTRIRIFFIVLNILSTLACGFVLWLRDDFFLKIDW